MKRWRNLQSMKNNHSNARTVLIIGAGAAGLMAGIRAAEKDI